MLSRFYCTCRLFGSAYWLLLAFSMLSACGGGSSAARFSGSSSSSAIVSGDPVTLSGLVTYDRVPHNQNHIGLNYNAITAMPVRGAVVELLARDGAVIGVTRTDSRGEYLLQVAKKTLVRVRVKAQLLQTTSPTLDIKVTDNTSNNAIYALTGSLATTGSVNTQRNLHAASGWDGGQYSATRTAAPFAILDDIYNAVALLSEVGNQANLPALELRWSSKNNTADGNKALGEISTSFFDSNETAIYILGDANNDTDEYDSHVISHEWGHYLEESLFRSDNLGGNHGQGDKLDMRVSMSEGFANAFSAIVLDDPYYVDASGIAEHQGFVVDISNRNSSLRGFYSENSIGSVFYNYYISAIGKPANDFSQIFTVLSSSSYIDHDAMTSIFLFYAQFKALLPSFAVEFGRLMQEQEIFGTTAYAENETNDGGYAAGLPLYKFIRPNTGALNLCSSAEFGKYNKYANSQLVVLDIAQAQSYWLSLVKFGGASVLSRPEVVIYRRGELIKYIANSQVDSVMDNLYLTEGRYILEVFDANNRNENDTQNTSCFDLQIGVN